MILPYPDGSEEHMRFVDEYPCYLIYIFYTAAKVSIPYAVTKDKDCLLKIRDLLLEETPDKFLVITPFKLRFIEGL
jgi:hypothetical protein